MAHVSQNVSAEFNKVLKNEGLQNILQRDNPHDTAVFVHDAQYMRLPGEALIEQTMAVYEFGDTLDGAADISKCHLGLVAGQAR